MNGYPSTIGVPKRTPPRFPQPAVRMRSVRRTSTFVTPLRLMRLRTMDVHVRRSLRIMLFCQLRPHPRTNRVAACYGLDHPPTCWIPFCVGSLSTPKALYHIAQIAASSYDGRPRPSIVSDYAILPAPPTSPDKPYRGVLRPRPSTDLLDPVLRSALSLRRRRCITFLLSAYLRVSWPTFSAIVKRVFLIPR